MLAIGPHAMAALTYSAQSRLLLKIDSWLSGSNAEWGRVENRLRHDNLAAMLERGRKAGMVCERDFAVFTWICVALGGKWFDRLNEHRVVEFLDSPEYAPEPKLLLLGEIFGL